MKDKIVVLIVSLAFGLFGVGLIYFGNSHKYDSKINAYKIDINEYESDDEDRTTMYRPIYYFRVNGKDYQCESKSGSSTYPNSNKKTVYYDSNNPTNCLTQYEKSTSFFSGILLIIVSIVVLVFGFLGLNKNKNNNVNTISNNDSQTNNALNNEALDKIENVVDKAGVVYNKAQNIFIKIVLVIVLIIVLGLMMIDVTLLYQTYKTKDYIETTATLVEDKGMSENEIDHYYVYSFVDSNGNEQKIDVTLFESEGHNNQIVIKYDKDNPKNFYTTDMLADNSNVISLIVKGVIFIFFLGLLIYVSKGKNKINSNIRIGVYNE